VTITGTNFRGKRRERARWFLTGQRLRHELERDKHRGRGASGATTGNVVVMVSSVASNGMSFTVLKRLPLFSIQAYPQQGRL